MKAYDGEITARSCFVKAGINPDAIPGLLKEVRAALENTVNTDREFRKHPATLHAATEAAVGDAIEFIEDNYCEFTNNAFGEGSKADADKLLATLRAIQGEAEGKDG